MKITPLFYVIIFLFIWGCKEEKQTTVNAPQNIISLDSASTQKVQAKLLALSSEAKKDLASYQDFQRVKGLMQTIIKENPYHIKKYADSLDFMVQTLEEELIKEYKTNAIQSRLTVLTTASGLLNQKAQSQPSEEKLLDGTKNLVLAYNSLIMQFNEFFLAIPENIEQELLQDQIDLRDSISTPSPTPIRE